MTLRWYWPSTFYGVLLVWAGVAAGNDNWWLFAFFLIASIVVDTRYDCLRSRR